MTKCSNDKELYIGLSSFDGHNVEAEQAVRAQETGTIKLGSCHWHYELNEIHESTSINTYECRFKLENQHAKQTRLFAKFIFGNYDENSFVFMPSAAYNGNKFKMVKVASYPPMFFKDVQAENSLHPDIVMQEIPSINNKFNRMVTDASTPLVAFFSPRDRKAFFLFCSQSTVIGNNAFEIDVPDDGTLSIMLSAPSVRRKIFNQYNNLDQAPDIRQGTEILLSFQTHETDCRNIEEFYDYFFEHRKCFIPEDEYANVMPFSRAAGLIIDTLNEARWRENFGFYSKSRNWQRLEIGWVCFMELPALICVAPPSVIERALHHLDLVLSHGQSSSGFFQTSATVRNGNLEWHPSFSDFGYRDHMDFSRFNADALHILMKILLLLDKLNIPYPIHWREAVRRLSEAFVKMWKKHGQFGFLMNVETGEVLVGGSTSGACAPGGLMLAGKYFNNHEFTEIALASAEQYYQRDFCDRGFTYGGPGDALLVPDSESAYGLLESLIIIFENNGDPVWLECAGHCAAYCASWTPSCKYKFPENSTFDRLDIDCRGAVQANLQNQHGAPGICTLSGNSLLRLYRASGNEKYLEMLRDIAHNITQYVGSPERPIIIRRKGGYLPHGDICEKVYFQDYSKSCGEIPFGTGGWPEIACLLSCVENPGIYYRLDTGLLIVLDHVEARLVDGMIEIQNVFDRDIEVSVLIDDAESIKRQLGELAHTDFLKVKLESKSSQRLDLTKAMVDN